MKMCLTRSTYRMQKNSISMAIKEAIAMPFMMNNVA